VINADPDVEQASMWKIQRDTRDRTGQLLENDALKSERTFKCVSLIGRHLQSGFQAGISLHGRLRGQSLGWLRRTVFRRRPIGNIERCCIEIIIA